MIVTCPSCRASLNIPDDRLPTGKVVNAACPRCKGAIAIDMTGAAAPPVTPASVEGPPPSQTPTPYGERGQPRALVCVTGAAERQQVLASLRQAGYAVQAANNPVEALGQLRFNAYAAAVVGEGFDPPADGGPSLWEALAEMPMGARRNTHVVFVGSGVTSHDPAAALAKSVDLVIHPNDVPHLADALKRSHEEKEEIYRIFRESQRTLGKG